mmetsp:Transcript_36847/g.111367  ORF Transcript_36847/g.111367 Transcript_36847/m.111367 type:complete len:242 (+) Transcript_36847:444-1169(+)
MPVLPAGHRPHAEQHVHVVGPAVCGERHAQGQLGLDAAQSQSLETRVHVLPAVVVRGLDEPVHGERRGEGAEDRRPVPCDLTAPGLDNERVALQEGPADGNGLDHRRAARRAVGVAALDMHAVAAHDPEIALLQHPELGLAVEHIDVRIAPEHARALLARRGARRGGGTRFVSSRLQRFAPPKERSLAAVGEEAVLAARRRRSHSRASGHANGRAPQGEPTSGGRRGPAQGDGRRHGAPSS